MLTATEEPVKVPVVDPAGIVTGLKTLIAELSEDSETATPPLGAAAASVTVQVVRAPPVTLLGVHCNEESAPLPETTEIVAVNEALA